MIIILGLVACQSAAKGKGTPMPKPSPEVTITLTWLPSPTPTVLQASSALTPIPVASSPNPAPSVTPTQEEELQLFSPLAEHSIEQLSRIVSDPYDPPPSGDDARHHGVDFCYYDGEEREFDETTTSTDRTLTIPFLDGDEEIEIIGSFVVPEFGAIAALILAIAIISIIAVSSKTRLSILPKY